MTQNSANATDTNAQVAEYLRGRKLEELPDLMTIKELSIWLQIPVNTIYDWNKRDEGPAPIKVGKHLRYPKENVIEWRAGLDRREWRTAA